MGSDAKKTGRVVESRSATVTVITLANSNNKIPSHQCNSYKLNINRIYWQTLMVPWQLIGPLFVETKKRLALQTCFMYQFIVREFTVVRISLYYCLFTEQTNNNYIIG